MCEKNTSKQSKSDARAIENFSHEKKKKNKFQPKNKEKRTEITKKKKLKQKAEEEEGIENATHQCIFRGAKSKAKESIAKPIFPPPFSAQLMALFAMAISQENKKKKKEKRQRNATQIMSHRIWNVHIYVYI